MASGRERSRALVGEDDAVVDEEAVAAADD
jgi:hypothetical protein